MSTATNQPPRFIPHPSPTRFGDNAFQVSMSPLTFIKLAVWSTHDITIAEIFTFRLGRVPMDQLVTHLQTSQIVPFSEGSFNHHREQILQGLPVDTPFLDVDVCGPGPLARPLGHEGRHRALAAYSLGIQQIPVSIFPACNAALVKVSWLTQEQKDKLDFTLRIVAV